MSDRELLELAARAAGIKLSFFDGLWRRRKYRKQFRCLRCVRLACAALLAGLAPIVDNHTAARALGMRW